jgi:hypothetical protein
VIPDAGHNYLIADIDGINHEVVEFLAGVDGAANADPARVPGTSQDRPHFH